MEQHIKEIGSFEAKTRLSELLRETENGTSYVIMRRGIPVARLLPPLQGRDEELRKTLDEFRAVRSKILERQGGIAFSDLKEIIEEGRQ